MEMTKSSPSQFPIYFEKCQIKNFIWNFQLFLKGSPFPYGNGPRALQSKFCLILQGAPSGFHMEIPDQFPIDLERTPLKASIW